MANLTITGLPTVTDADGFDFIGADPSDQVAKNMTGQTLSKAITPVKLIYTASNLTDLATANVITISVPTTIIFRAAVASTVQFVIESGGALFIGTEGVNGSYAWGGTGTLFSGSGFLIVGSLFALTSTSTGTLFDMTLASFASIQLGASRFDGFDALGEVNGRTITMQTTFFTNWGTGLTLKNMSRVNCEAVTSVLGSTTETFLKIVYDKDVVSLIEPKITLANNVFGLLGTSHALRIDPDINDTVNVSIVNGKVSGGGGLYDTAGTTGTFTAVADATVSATAITSVTDSSGTARFNFSVGPTLFVGQRAVISTFTTNTAYNATGIVTATGAGYFEIADIVFGSDETGSFLSNSVTVTDTATTLSNGDTLTLDTTSATDYDGGSVVYNKQTNTFQVNMAYTATKAGTWNTGGINQKDPRVVAVEQRELPDSRYIATAFVNNNATATGAIVNNTFTDMVFGTAGSALVAGSTMERWKLIDDVKGIFEYTGTEPFAGFITFDYTVTSSGGAVEFRFRWQIDTGSGFGDLPDPVESLVEIGSDAGSVTKAYPLLAVRGNQIKPEITRNSGSSGITTSYATIYVEQ